MEPFEEETKRFPLLTETQAAKYLGGAASTNPSAFLLKAKQEKQLFVFYFDDPDVALIPEFQFNPSTHTIYPSVPRLCQLLEGLNDYGVYIWLIHHDEDLGASPAEVLGTTENEQLQDDLFYLAGLFKSESTLQQLNFIAEDS
ncbi:hypothetical protein [Vibrio sinaloensis]|uniref:hypothetical protein n=1 Tax=Photobacterium sp. (strain ATCC 43367) TaxID=379097 RepID=UPI00068A1429|nr:hypothetical protein [Vibrio sinaloensis]